MKKVEDIEKEQKILEGWQDRNSDPTGLLKRQKTTTMNLKNEHNGMKTDIHVSTNRIKDLETRGTILDSAILDLLKDKRIIDKKNMELKESIDGRNVTEFQEKMKHKEQERIMRIGKEQIVSSLRRTGMVMMDQTTWEETRSKDILDQKLNLEQKLLDKREQLEKEVAKQDANREDLIKLRVKDSQLDSQK